jgi:hypothetical protein
MPSQHLHVHALVVVPDVRLDFSGQHVLLREHPELGWHSLHWSDKAASPSHAAAYLGAYVAKVEDDPWQWARLHRLLGRRWGESWGLLRAGEASVRVPAEDAALYVHAVAERQVPEGWAMDLGTVRGRLRPRLRELRRVLRAGEGQ